MNRRKLFISTAKAAFASAVGGSLLGSEPTFAQAQLAKGAAGPPNMSVLPYPDPQFNGVIGRTTEDSKPDFPQPILAPEGAPQCVAHSDRRRRLRRVQCVRGADSDADVGCACSERSEVQRLQHHCPVLADAGGPHHRARPAPGAYRHHYGTKPRLPGLQFSDAQKRRHGRRNLARQRLQHCLVRQEP